MFVTASVLVTCCACAPQEWWDQCPDAGPKQRPREPYGKPVPTLALLTFQDSKVARLAFTLWACV